MDISYNNKEQCARMSNKMQICSVFTNLSQEHASSLFPVICNFDSNTTSDLVKRYCFVTQKVVLLLIAFTYGTIWRARLRELVKMVVLYRPWFWIRSQWFFGLLYANSLVHDDHVDIMVFAGIRC